MHTYLTKITLSSFFLDTPSAQIHCYQFSRGKALLIALPGYGKDYSMFKDWATVFEGHFSLVVMHPPAHGKTPTPSQGLSSERLWEWINCLQKKLDPTAPIHLLGFSMGSLFCLDLLQSHPERIERVWLISPIQVCAYGQRHYLWFLARLSSFSKYFFRHPNWANKKLQQVIRWGWINQIEARFVSRLFDNKDAFDAAVYMQSNLHKVALSRRQIKHILKEKGEALWMVLGHRDTLIKSSLVRLFKQWLSPGHILQIRGGHYLISKELAHIILTTPLEETQNQHA